MLRGFLYPTGTVKDGSHDALTTAGALEGREPRGVLYTIHKRPYAHGRCRKMSNVRRASRRRAIDKLETTLLDKHGDRFSIAPRNSIERVHRK